MRHLPTFFDLAGRTVVVAGRTPAAAQRIRLVLAAGGSVRLIASTEAGDISPDVATLAAGADIEVRAGAGRLADFSAAALAIVASGDAVTDARLAGLARAAGVPVNVVDRPGLSDFILPAIVDRGDVVIGISTGGASPTLARLIRGQVERAIPSRVGALAAWARRVREKVRERIAAPDRRAFWETALQGPIADRVLAGRDAEADRALDVALGRAANAPPPSGIVHIVGAGPGDPELLTLKALRLMRDADVVLYDELVAAGILDLVRRDARRIAVGKRKGQPGMPQAAINDLLVTSAREGLRVVRLKSGDPFVFGRGGEELEYLRRHDIDADVVPGITAALGCAAAVGLPLSHRDHASAITLVTGRSRDGEIGADLPALVKARHTVAIYMGVGGAGDIRQALLSGGVAAATPVALIENGTRASQRTSVGTLGDLPRLAARHATGGPTLLVIGAVAALAQSHAPVSMREAS